MSENEYFSSDFEPFGFLEFSGQEPLAKRIYDSLRESLGDSFIGPDQDAETYADAMCLAAAQLQIECASAQDDPNQTNYLLTDLERDYRIIVPFGATIEERRAELLAAQLAASGSRAQVIQDGLEAILGDYLLGWRFMNLDPTDPDSEVQLTTVTPVFVPATTRVNVIRFTSYIMPGVQTVPFEWLCESPSGISKNDRFTVDPSTYSTQEAIDVSSTSVDDDGNRYLTATFSKPHNPNVVATTAPQPFWSSSKGHCMIVVADYVLNNRNLISRVFAFLRKTLGGTSTWALCQTTGTPYGDFTGPFLVGSGRIGQTPISTAEITI